MRTFNINGSTVQTVDVMSNINARFEPSRVPKWVLMFYSTTRRACHVRLDLTRVSMCENDLVQ